jgi:hypothetical protein
MATDHLLPTVDDLDTRGFWQAAADGRLVVRVCGNCQTVLHLPRAYCSNCGSFSEEWAEADGNATLYSWTVIHHQVHPGYPTPYTVLLVELVDFPGVRLLGHVDGEPTLSAGMPLRVRFDALAADTALPQWEPVDGWQYQQP